MKKVGRFVDHELLALKLHSKRHPKDKNHYAKLDELSQLSNKVKNSSLLNA